MKSVLISIQPKWCELIASGKKTVEVRKTRPKLDTPFKVYIYCTKARMPIRDNGRILMYEDDLAITNRWGQGKLVENPCGAMWDGEFFLNGKVIGEFVCDKVEQGHILWVKGQPEYYEKTDEKTQLTYRQMLDYLGEKGIGYFWHISDLVIYDEPRELSEFWKADKCPYASENGCTYKHHCFRSGQVKRCGETLTRPPQSWCYVERSDNNGK